MPSRNKAVLIAVALLAGCGGGEYADAPVPAAPIPLAHSDDPRPQADFPSSDQSASQADASTAGGPPPSSGPSGTSSGVRYDQVGYANWYGDELRGSRTASGDRFDPDGMTAAHRTLPLGSYAEVTALDTGRTILVLINDRGPFTGNRMIDLSHGAANALGIDGQSGAPVRVRSVPTSPQDAIALRTGQPASPRLDAPPTLLAALRKELPGGGGKAPSRATVPVRSPDPVHTPLTPTGPSVQGASYAAPSSHSAAPAPATNDGYYVQIAALSNVGRADTLARQTRGRVAATGGIYRVQLGPFRDLDAAQRARDAAARQGYGDARIVRPTE